ncbi:hypothetical protein HDIA_4139 [Hartmannibacter diazotrophicus]|uniref:CENP-V/GFA domain-containing protein n=1 Tax=Hartmannibacter diazotrophicus TaxID=1482074 RepID=A0A2C9DBY3_9HYPH|nr:GFA family protein [Hartmannibacter diazotrophicus]SON57680.1 hypothetical protein HDIA_4139 [Hartmannibacter diazotrophicus]
MADLDRPLLGTCRCGHVGIEISAPPLLTAACHCRGCQTMSASAYSLTALIPAPAFRVTSGEPVKGGAGGAQLDHYFCPDCKTWMFTRISGIDAFVNVRPTLLDDPRWTLPFIETQTAEKLPWVETPACYSYERFPSEEEFEGLVKAFAEEV